jgi:DMSO/TMAO reductase YedYZ molybdopterin-dependent catalytic subunit
VPVLDPEEACQAAIDQGLLVHRAHPLNCETPIPALVGGVAMPNARFYVRNHFQIPALDASAWRLDVGGLVERPLKLGLRDITAMPSRTLTVTLECAGNGRRWLDPPVEGEQWRLGAVSTAEWTGVPLAQVLDRAGIKPAARELVFRGADGGAVGGHGVIAFERSLTLEAAREGEALLAHGMNGEPLPVRHGYPLRLIVPGWYGVASVKWLTRIEAVPAAFDGYFQADRYWYETHREGTTVREPASLQRVRALIAEPGSGDEVARGDVAIRGVAWSGAGPIARVDVSVDGGPWQPARQVGGRRRHSWQWWEFLTRLDRPGPVSFRARATDLAGRTQPETPEWNRYGYGNNATQQVSVVVV